MSKPYIVNLDIRNSKQSDQAWTNVRASNNKWYAYQYTGGSDGHGNITEKGRGTVDITVNLICDNRYEITSVMFKDDPENQLSCPTRTTRSAIIVDLNDAVQSDAYYSITIQDTTAKCTLVCDPYISNVP